MVVIQCERVSKGSLDTQDSRRKRASELRRESRFLDFENARLGEEEEEENNFGEVFSMMIMMLAILEQFAAALGLEMFIK